MGIMSGAAARTGNYKKIRRSTYIKYIRDTAGNNNKTQNWMCSNNRKFIGSSDIDNKESCKIHKRTL